MIRYYKLRHHPEWYYKVEGKNAWCIHHPPPPPEGIVNDNPVSVDNPISADALIKNCELIELTKEQLFLELL